FIGLDIGRDTTKIILVRRGFRDLEVIQTLTLKSEFFNRDNLHDLKRAFSENPLPGNEVAAAIPFEPISIKAIQFPFVEPKKIDQVYQFELENVSTFDPDDKVHGYHLVKQGNKAEALVCMFEKDHMKNLLDMCRIEGIDPKVVTYGPVAMASLESYLPKERPLIIIDIGATKIGFCVFDGGGIRRVRSTSKAGDIVTESISKILGVPHDDAESVKREGLEGGYADIIREALNPVLVEIKKTIKFFEMELKEDIKTVLLCGGMSLMPGISDYFRDSLNKEVREIFIPELGLSSPTLVQSFALAVYGSALKRSSLNFRKGEYQYTGSDEELKKKFIMPTILLSIIVFLLLYRYGSTYFELKNRVDRIEREIEANVKQAFPDIKVIPKPVAFMESEFNKVNEKLELVHGVVGRTPPLEVLKDISLSIPKGINLTVDEIDFVDDKTVRMIGRCDSYQEVAKIEKALTESGKFETVNRDSTNPSVNNTIKFQVSLVVR
ncbi:MAG: pilus assembly protein PilM, partial [Deltaproteobacteria bacterium]|nr:pilus assembly protein PilM [Deltaproteobacteria bacterium]